MLSVICDPMVCSGTKFSGTKYPNPITPQFPGGTTFPQRDPAESFAFGQPANQQTANKYLGATTFNYDVRLILDSSFTGKDLLRTVLRAGNFLGANGSAFGQGLTFLETAFEESAGDNIVGINRLFYNFPLGKDFSVTVGPRVRVDDAGMLGMWPSVYPADTVLDFFTYAGAPGAYNLLALGGGAGLTYNNVLGAEGWTLSTNYVSTNAATGNPNSGGVMTDGSSSASVTQLAYTGGKFPVIGGSAWGLAAAYTYAQNLGLPSGTPLGLSFGSTGSNNSVGISGYWVPETTGWIPSVSTGWGTTASEFSTIWDNSKWTRTSSWYLGLQWPDTFVKGNDLGMAVGQAPYMTGNGAGNYSTASGINGNLDSNYMWEWWYKFQVTDNITVTPAIYWIQNYVGQDGRVNLNNGSYSAATNAFGGLLKTTFKF